MHKRKLIATAIATLLALTATLAQAQTGDFPNRPVKIVLPVPPGSPTDAIARIVANALSQRWSQPVVVENKAGAGGRIAYETVAHAPADGYTLVGTASALTTMPYLYSNLGFNAEKDFAPITQLISNVAVLAVQPNLPGRTLPEFVAWSKANKGVVNYGSPGKGTIIHMTFELINSVAGSDFTDVPFLGVPQYMQAFLRGDVHLVYLPYTMAVPHVEQGKMKIISVVGDQRLPEIPNVPTLKESGYMDYVPTSWNGLAAPAATPKPILDKIAADVIALLKRPDIAEQIRQVSGAVVVGSSREEHTRMVQTEFKVWGDVARRTGMKPQ